MTHRDDRNPDEPGAPERDREAEQRSVDAPGESVDSGARKGATKKSQFNPDDARDEDGPLEGRSGSGQGRAGQMQEDTEF